MFNKNDREKETNSFIVKTKTWQFTLTGFNDYVNKCGGINKLKSKDLYKIMVSQNNTIAFDEGFMAIYNLVLKNESEKTIKIWTWIAGSATVINLLVSILLFFNQL